MLSLGLTLSERSLGGFRKNQLDILAGRHMYISMLLSILEVAVEKDILAWVGLIFVPWLMAGHQWSPRLFIPVWDDDSD